MKKLAVALLAILSLALMGQGGVRIVDEAPGTRVLGSNVDDRSPVPGMLGGMGNEDTLNYLLNLSTFYDIPDDKFTAVYYVSADDGGAADEGDDEAAGTSWATAWQSLCRVDYAIETMASTDRIKVYLDSDGGNDVWDILATELDCLDTTPATPAWDNAAWDGSIGPPGGASTTAIGSIDDPAVVIVASDPANRADLFLHNLPQSQTSEACNDNGGGSPPTDAVLDCHDENDGLFFAGYYEGFPGSNNDVARSFMWVENVKVRGYPPTPETSTYTDFKDIVAGNVLTLNMEVVALTPCDQCNFSSNHGGMDAHIQPIISMRDTNDFASGCSGGSSIGCANVDNMSQTLLCSSTIVGADSTDVAGSANDCNTTTGIGPVQPLITNAGAVTVLISDQTYTNLSHIEQAGTRYETFIKANSATTMHLIGPMTFENGVFSDNADLAAVKWETTNPAGSASAGYAPRQLTMSFVNLGSAANPDWGVAPGAKDLQGSFIVDIMDNGKAVANWYDTSVTLYDVHAANLDGGLVRHADLVANHSAATDLNLYCLSVDESNMLIELGYNNPAGTAAAGSIDLDLEGLYLGANANATDGGDTIIWLGSLGYVHTTGTSADPTAGTDDCDDEFTESNDDALYCKGDPNCDVGCVDGPLTNGAVGTEGLDRDENSKVGNRNACTKEWEFTFHDHSSVNSSNYPEEAHAFYLPARAVGAKIEGFRWGYTKPRP